MAREVFVFYEDKIEIYRGASLLSKISLPIQNNIGLQQNVDFFKNFIQETGLKIKRANVVYAMDGIITRTVEIPKIKPKDVEKYINNNIDEYFTININEYYFDFKISKKSKNNINVFIVAVPKNKINDIRNLLSSIEIEIKSINVYPDILSSYFYNKKGDFGIVDIHEDRTYLTLIDNGEVFLSSSLINEFEDSYMSQEYIDNINYFLNFYSTRHFGKRIDKLYIVGQVNERLKSILNENIDIDKEYEIEKLTKRNKTSLIIYPYLRGTIKKGRYINLMDIFKPKDVFKQNIIIAASLVTIITVSWTTLALYLIDQKMHKFDIDTLQKRYEKYKDVEALVNELQQKKNSLEYKAKLLEDIKKENVDVVAILNTLKDNLPRNIFISNISIDKENVDVTFIFKDKKTLDAAKLVVALNKTGIFQQVDLDKVNLDDNVDEITLKLKLGCYYEQK